MEKDRTNSVSIRFGSGLREVLFNERSKINQADLSSTKAAGIDHDSTTVTAAGRMQIGSPFSLVFFRRRKAAENDLFPGIHVV